MRLAAKGKGSSTSSSSRRSTEEGGLHEGGLLLNATCRALLLQYAEPNHPEPMRHAAPRPS